jgi:PAS domain S-box-containing protein
LRKRDETVYSELLNHIQDGVWVTDSNNRLVFFNGAMERIAGVSAAAVVGLDITADFPSETTDQFLPFYREARISLKPVEYEAAVVTPTGRQTVQAGWLTPRIRDGCFDGMICTIRDMTDRKMMEDALKRSEERYRLIDDSSVDFVCSYDLDGRITHANRSFCNSRHLSRDEIIGKTHKELGFSENQCKEWEKLHQRVYAVNDTIRSEMLTPMPDGALRYYEVTLNPLHDADGVAIGIAGATRDITERKWTENAVAASERRHRGSLDNLNVGVVVHAPDTEVIYSNHAANSILGLTMEQMLGKTAMDPYWKFINEDGTDMSPMDYPVSLTLATRAELKDHTVGIVRGENEQVRWVVCNGHSVLDERGELSHLLISFVDITERKQAEEALLASEAKYHDTILNLMEGFYNVTLDGKLLDYNAEFTRILGLDPNRDHTGISLPNFWLNPEDRNHYLKELSSNGFISGYILNARTENGEAITIQANARLIKNAEKEPPRIEGTFLDITERMRAEEALRVSETKFKTIFENKGTGTGTYGDDGIIRECNSTFAELIGYSRSQIIDKMTWSNFVVEEDLERMQQFHSQRSTTEGGPPSQYECRLTSKQGKLIDVIVNISVIDKIRIVSLIDITQRRRAEKEKLAMEGHLRQAQKLESIGTLASGVAHEINNPLMGMMNYAELAKDRIKDAKAIHFLTEIGHEGNRIAKIVRSLLSFSRQDEEDYSLAEIKDIIDSSLSLVGSVLRKDQITVELNIPENLPQLKCRSQQIQQVIINLLTNAQYALNARYPEYDENKLICIAAIPSENDGENWIRITVEDHGVGIPEGVRERIFDPFFTTKSRHEGTGLGLSVSFGIIKEHQGELTVESVPKVSTRFSFKLPID